MVQRYHFGTARAVRCDCERIVRAERSPKYVHRAHLELTSPFMNLSTDEGRPILSRAAAISDLRVVAKVYLQVRCTLH